MNIKYHEFLTSCACIEVFSAIQTFFLPQFVWSVACCSPAHLFVELSLARGQLSGHLLVAAQLLSLSKATRTIFISINGWQRSWSTIIRLSTTVRDIMRGVATD